MPTSGSRAAIIAWRMGHVNPAAAKLRDSSAAVRRYQAKVAQGVHPSGRPKRGSSPLTEMREKKHG